jgi:hypothetical protein
MIRCYAFNNLNFCSFLFFSFFSLVFGAEGEITLVTVGESSSGSECGGTADLFLEVKPGSGRFLLILFLLLEKILKFLFVLLKMLLVIF